MVQKKKNFKLLFYKCKDNLVFSDKRLSGKKKTVEKK